MKSGYCTLKLGYVFDTMQSGYNTLISGYGTLISGYGTLKSGYCSLKPYPEIRVWYPEIRVWIWVLCYPFVEVETQLGRGKTFFGRILSYDMISNVYHFNDLFFSALQIPSPAPVIGNRSRDTCPGLHTCLGGIRDRQCIR